MDPGHCFLEIRRMSTIRHYLTDDAPKLLFFPSYSHASTIAASSLSAGLPQSLVGKLRRVQNCAARLVVRGRPHVHIASILRHLHWLPVRADIIPSTPAYLSDLLQLYSPSRSFAPVLTPASSKIPLYKCKTKGDRAFYYSGLSV